MVRRIIAFVVLASLAVVVPQTVAAHEVTHKGTVVTADAKAVKVTVVNIKTKKPEDMVFKLEDVTKILRGDKVVKFAEAKIAKGEKIAVTVDHDGDPEAAMVIRLDAKK